MKRYLKLILRVLISCLLMSYLVFKVEWPRILYAVKEIDSKFYVLSTLLSVVSSFFLGWKYYLLIKETSIARSILSLVKINFISRFYALFLPSALGPEAVRWYKVTRNKNGRAFFSASVIFERLTFLVILILCGLIPLFWYSTNSEIATLRAHILPALLAALCVICLLIVYFIYPVLRSLLRSLFARYFSSWRISKDISLFLQNFSIKNNTLSLLLYMFMLSLLWQAFFLVRLFVLFKAASLPLSFVDIAWMGSLVLLLQVIPISFAGIGVREGAYAYLFTVFGLAPGEGVLIGILFFSQMLILAGIGGLLELFEH